MTSPQDLLTDGDDVLAGRTVFARRAGDIGFVVLGGERAHVLTEDFPEQLIHALDALVAARVRAIVLAGTTKVFCAGADIKLADRLQEPEFGARWLTAQHEAVARLAELDVPTVSAVHAAAAGGGCNLAIACDFVIASTVSSFSQAFIRIGLATDMGSLYLLPRRVGFQRARALMLTGRTISAQEALGIGLIDELVEPGELVPRARQLAENLAAKPLRAYAAIKRGMATASELGLRESLAVEAELQRPVLRSRDFAEGTTAFLQKRPAAFSDR